MISWYFFHEKGGVILTDPSYSKVSGFQKEMKGER
jgi:hypothetical protein